MLGLEAILAILGTYFVVGVVSFAFWVWMLVDIIKYQEKDRVMWILIILLTGILGAIIYFFVARRERKKEKK